MHSIYRLKSLHDILFLRFVYLGKLDEKSLDELHILLILYGGSENQNLFLHIGTFLL